MRRFLSIFIVTLLGLFVFAGQGMGPGPGVKSYSGSASCQASPWWTNTTNDAGQNVGDYATRTFYGIAWASGFNHSGVCKVDIYVRAKSGTKTWQVEIWTYNSSTYALETLKGTSDTVASSSITAGTWVSFNFSTPVTGIPSNYVAIVLTPSDHTTGSYYLEVAQDTGRASGDPQTAGWAANQSATYSDDTKQFNFKVYAYE